MKIAENDIKKQSIFKTHNSKTFELINFTKELIKEVTVNKGLISIDKFEEYSIYVKKKFEAIYKFSISKSCKNKLDFTQIEKENILKNKKKLKKLEKENCIIDDIKQKARLFETVGINFGKNEWYKVELAIKNLVNIKTKSIRYWGKIYGIDSDYNVFQVEYHETKPKKYISGIDSSYQEGANKFKYFVSSNVLDEYIELPDVNQNQIKLSRMFKYQLTGNLNASVKSFFPFPGKESHLLKCYILRITHSSCIVPEGYLEIKQIENSQEIFGIDLTDKVTQVKEDFVITSTVEETSAPEKWIHEYAYISDEGKIIDIPTESNPPPRMSSIAGDKRKYL